MKTKFFEAARSVAMVSKGIGKRKNFRHGAVIVNKNKILSVGHNSYKTHPIMAKYTIFPHLHAEQSAIINLGLFNCAGTDLYVVRINRQNDFMMSKPCIVCKRLIDEITIRNVYYTDRQGKHSTL